MGLKIPAKKGPAFQRNDSGQTTIEYVLLLTVTVGLILLFSTVFYKPFQTYMNNYMGKYLQCLLLLRVNANSRTTYLFVYVFRCPRRVWYG